jgi:hypothetical protein
MRSFLASMLLLFMLVGPALAQSDQTSPDARAALELRASQAFNKGDYTVALPMLQKLAGELQGQKDQADKLAMVQEQIRVCQKNAPIQLASASPSPTAAAVTSVGDASPALPPQPPMSPTEDPGPGRKPHGAPKSGMTQEMSIKELGNFNYDAEHGSPIPDDVKALSGSMVRLRGFMIPMDQAENISKFALVPSLFSCCFGQPPQIQHTIVVSCPKGKAVSYYPDEIIVEGKLNVEEKKDDGFVVSIFELETTSVKPAPK